MQVIKYDLNKINEMLNILNTLPFKGFENAQKMVAIFNILDNPINEDNKDVK